MENLVSIILTNAGIVEGLETFKVEDIILAEERFSEIANSISISNSSKELSNEEIEEILNCGYYEVGDINIQLHWNTPIEFKKKLEISDLPFRVVPVLDSSESLCIVNSDDILINIRRFNFVSINLLNICGRGDCVDYDVYALPKDLSLAYHSYEMLADDTIKVKVTLPFELADRTESITKQLVKEYKDICKDHNGEVAIEVKIAEGNFYVESVDDEEIKDLVANHHFEIIRDISFLTNEWNKWLDNGYDKQSLFLKDTSEVKETASDIIPF